MFKKILALLVRAGGDPRKGRRRSASTPRSCDHEVDLEEGLRQFREEIDRFKERVASLELHGRPGPGIRNPEVGRPPA